MSKKLIKSIGDQQYCTPESGQTLPDRLQVPTSMNQTEDPTSLVNFVPKKMAAAIKSFSQSLLRMTEADLRRELKPDDLLCRLRLSFWDEYQRAHNTDGKMVTLNVVRGVCTEDYFYKWIMPDLMKMRWICQVPKDYYLAMREMHDRGLDRLREVLELDFFEEKCVRTSKDTWEIRKFVNTKVLAEVRAAVQMLDLRIKGAVLQKMQIQQKSLNYNINHEANDTDLENLTLEQLTMLEGKIQKLDERIVEVSALPTTTEGYVDVSEESPAEERSGPPTG